MRTFGLVGASLAHSFSPKFFETYFRKQQIEDIERENVKMFGRIQKQKASISFH
jgi:shikimate 5-dehydrogenase